MYLMFSLSLVYLLGDNTLRIWDISAPPRAQQTIRAHDGEVLTCDWAKYDAVSIYSYIMTRDVGLNLTSYHVPLVDGKGEVVLVPLVSTWLDI